MIEAVFHAAVLVAALSPAIVFGMIAARNAAR